VGERERKKRRRGRKREREMGERYELKWVRLRGDVCLVGEK
jgi:hypothetical protein